MLIKLKLALCQLSAFVIVTDKKGLLPFCYLFVCLKLFLILICSSMVSSFVFTWIFFFLCSELSGFPFHIFLYTFSGIFFMVTIEIIFNTVNVQNLVWIDSNNSNIIQKPSSQKIPILFMWTVHGQVNYGLKFLNLRTVRLSLDQTSFQTINIKRHCPWWLVHKSNYASRSYLYNLVMVKLNPLTNFTNSNCYYFVEDILISTLYAYAFILNFLFGFNFVLMKQCF